MNFRGPQRDPLPFGGRALICQQSAYAEKYIKVR